MQQIKGCNVKNNNRDATNVSRAESQDQIKEFEYSSITKKWTRIACHNETTGSTDRKLFTRPIISYNDNLMCAEDACFNMPTEYCHFTLNGLVLYIQLCKKHARLIEKTGDVKVKK